MLVEPVLGTSTKMHLYLWQITSSGSLVYPVNCDWHASMRDENWSAGTRTRNQPRKLSGLLSLSQFPCRIQCRNRKLRVLFALELKFNCPCLNHRRYFFRCREDELPAETPCRVITSTLVLSNPAIQIFGGTDVISSRTAQNVNPSHRKCGSAGTRTRNQRLKRALLYRLSYRPAASTLGPRRNFSIQNQPRKPSGLLYRLSYRPAWEIF